MPDDDQTPSLGTPTRAASAEAFARLAELERTLAELPTNELLLLNDRIEALLALEEPGVDDLRVLSGPAQA